MRVYVELHDEMSDAAVRHAVEQLLDLRRKAAAGHPAGLRMAGGAAAMLAEVTRQLSGWFCRSLRLVVHEEDFRRQPDSEIRRQIAACLDLRLPIFQPEARQDLFDALVALNAGRVLPLVQTNVRRRRGELDTVAEAEFRILAWIQYQHGLGRTLTEARKEAARAVICSVHTIKSWRMKAEEVFGTREVQDELQLAERLGRYVAQGKTPQDLRPRESDEDQMLWEAWFRIPCDIKERAEIRRDALRQNTKSSLAATEN